MTSWRSLVRVQYRPLFAPYLDGQRSLWERKIPLCSAKRFLAWIITAIRQTLQFALSNNTLSLDVASQPSVIRHRSWSPPGPIRLQGTHSASTLIDALRIESQREKATDRLSPQSQVKFALFLRDHSQSWSKLGSTPIAIESVGSSFRPIVANATTDPNSTGAQFFHSFSNPSKIFGVTPSERIN